MQLKVSAGEEFDICYTADWIFNYSQNVAKGSFIALDEIIDEYAAQTKELIPQKIWNATKVKGKIYGVPNYQVSFRQNSMNFKKDLVDKYNLKDAIFNIKKMSDLNPIFETIKKNEPGVYLTDVGPWTQFTIGSKDEYLEMFDFSIPVGIDYNLNIVDLNNDPAKLAIKEQEYKLTREWYEKGYFHKDVAIAKDLNPEKKAGKFFMIGDVYKPGGEQDMKNRYGYDFYTVPIGMPILSTGSITATLNAISRSSKNPERAMMLLNQMNTDVPLYNLLVFGQEGKHYNKIDDKHIKVVEGAKYSGFAWLLGCQFNAYLIEGQADDVWDLTKKLNEEAVEAPTLGFTFDSSPVKTQIANIKSATEVLGKVTLNGIIDMNKYKTMKLDEQDKVNKAGLKEIIAELQKQLDEWKSSK